jgi:preprotein translocase subunit SecE
MAKVEKEKKENKHFFKDFKAELKKVIWPTPKQVLNNTTAVIAIVLLTALIVFVLDLAFETINTHGINNLKNLVSSNENTVSDNTIDDETTDDDTSAEDATESEETNTETDTNSDDVENIVEE